MNKCVAIIGWRAWNNWEAFEQTILNWIGEYGKPEMIVTGDATGVDSMARRFAKEYQIELRVHVADWSTGDSAGPARNRLIVRDCTHMIAFCHHDPSSGKLSPGTKSATTLAEKANKPMTKVNID